MTLDVAANSEEFMCQLVTFPEDGYVTAAQHEYTAGSHHFLLYTTDFDTIPEGGDQIQDCAANNGEVLSHARGVFYAAQTPKGGFSYPAGVGLPAKKNQVLLFQVHYLNAGANTLHVNVNASFTVDTVGTSITQHAGFLFWYDPFIHVPAGAMAKAQMRCPVPNDITLMSAVSHYHKRGVNYGAYIDTASGAPSTMPFYTSANWENPETFTGPKPVSAGSTIHFECDYDNTAGSQEFFQGQSAVTNEMCMFIANYYPAPEPTDFCPRAADMGTGTVGCSDTVSCLGTCAAQGKLGAPSGDASAPLTALDRITPCMQSCITNSCPAASGPSLDVFTCIAKSCISACSGGGSGDAGADAASTGDGGVSDSCVQCLLANCPVAAGACNSASSCSAP